MGYTLYHALLIKEVVSYIQFLYNLIPKSELRVSVLSSQKPHSLGSRTFTAAEVVMPVVADNQLQGNLTSKIFPVCYSFACY